MNESLFESWQEIKELAEKHELYNLANRLQLNNDMWNSSGEFGRDQVAICDAIRFCANIDDALDVMAELDEEQPLPYFL